MSATSIGFDIYAKDRASAVFDKVGRKAGETAGFFAKHKAAIAGGAAIAGAAVVKFGSDSIAAFTDADKSQRVLADAYQRFPALADVNISALQDQAAALQNKTKFDGDNINAMQGTLAQYKLSGSQIQQLTPLILDYAQKTGKDLPEAADVVGKAMLGQGRALKDVGIKFKDTGTATGNFKELMGGLRTQVGGFAEKEGKSAEGQAAILANNFGDVQEAIGQKLLPVAQKLTGWALTALGWMQQHATLMQVIVGVVGTLAVGFGALMVIQKVSQAMAILNVVMAANPIGIVVVAIAALAAGLIYAYQNSQTFRNIVNGAFQAIAAIARWFWNSVMAPVIRFLIGGFASVADWIGNMLDALSHIPGFGWAKDAADKMHGAAGKARDLANSIRDIPDKTVSVSINVNTYYKTHGTPNPLSTVGSGAGVKGYASGGSDIPAGLAWVGEKGPELMYVPGGSSIFDARTSARMAAKAGRAGASTAGRSESTSSEQPLIVQFVLDGRVVQQSLLKLKRTQGNASLGLA